MYVPDLAYIHHHGFGAFARNAAPGLLTLLRKTGIPAGTVVDLGCGSGIWLRELDRAGYKTIGIDQSPALLALAREIAPEALLHEGSVYDFEFPDCDAVTALGEVLSYLPNGAESLPWASLFERIAAALRPGGLLVFDLMMHEGKTPMAYRSWQAGADWAVLVETSEDRERRLLTRSIMSFREGDQGYRRSEERHRVYMALRSEVETLLRSAGFNVRVRRRYGEMKLGPRRMAFVARRV